MKSTLLLSLLALFLISCSEPDQSHDDATPDATGEEVESATGTDEDGAADAETVEPAEEIDISKLPPIDIPDGYVLLKQADGDLDGEPGPERVMVFDTARDGGMKAKREIRVYRATESGWEVWHAGEAPVLNEYGGGVFGDPFMDLTIERRAIVIEHFGGSRMKWGFTHRYRFQDGAFRLIGATHENHTPCYEFDKTDHNLSTGKVIFTAGPDECEDVEPIGAGDIVVADTTFTRKVNPLPVMDGYDPWTDHAKVPDHLKK